MKISHFRIQTLLFILILLLQCSFNTVYSQNISFKIKLKSESKFDLKASPLKFNKHFAYCFTLDDGYRSAYLTAFPLLNGGKISNPDKNEWKVDQGGD